MIIFLYGQDTYRSRQKLNEIIENYKKAHKSGVNLKIFGGNNFDFDEIQNEIKQASIISGKKLLLLKDAFSNAGFKEKFLKNSKSFINSKDLIVFYEEKEITKTNSLFKLLKKSAKSQEFEPLDGQSLKNWIKKEFDDKKAKTEAGVTEKLISFIGSDSWRLSNEIRKLASFAKNKIIQIKDVDLLVKPKIETDVFKTIDAIAEKNKKQALELLHKHLSKGDSPLYLLSMINFQFRNLILIKNLVEKDYTSEKIQKSTKLHPYVVRKSLWQIRKFSSPELKKIYQRIFKVDMDIKRGRIEPELALDLLITAI